MFEQGSSIDSKAAGDQAWSMFLKGRKGPLFSVYFRPDSNKYRGHDVLILPAFGDEMNKVRRMLALQGRRLARCGTGTLMVDLYGTGDSGGDFSDAAWETWQSDVGTALEWLTSQGCRRLGILAVRMGALLAPAAIESANAITRLVLWQPALRGDAMLTQFLRLRTAGALTGRSTGKAESTAALKARLSRGENVEVTGYELGAPLVDGMDRAALADIPIDLVPHTYWFEALQGNAQAVPPASSRVIEAWRRQGAHVTAETILSAPYWTGPDIMVVPDLLDKTTDAFVSFYGHE